MSHKKRSRFAMLIAPLVCSLSLAVYTCSPARADIIALSNIEFTPTSAPGQNVVNVEIRTVTQGLGGQGIANMDETKSDQVTVSSYPGSPLLADLTINMTGNQVELMAVNFTSGKFLGGNTLNYSYTNGLNYTIENLSSRIFSTPGGGYFAPIAAGSNGSFEATEHFVQVQEGLFSAYLSVIPISSTNFSDPGYTKHIDPGLNPGNVALNFVSSSSGMATYEVVWTMPFSSFENRTEVANAFELYVTTTANYQLSGTFTVPIPEPTGGLLSLSAALGLLLVRRRKK